MPIDPMELAAAIADAIGRGAIPGLGAGQNDTKSHADNVDATHALNIRYVIPSNSQRVVAAKLSFHLAAFRDYDTGVSTTTSGASSSVTSTATAVTHQHHIPFNGAAPTMAMGLDAGGNFVVNGAAGSLLSNNDPGATHSHDNPHTHDVTPTLTRGVFEGTVAAGVGIAFDGVDKTAALGGPWSVDVVELDVTRFIQSLPDKKYHTIALTPSGLGRIEADLRINYFANAGIPA